MKMRTLLLQVVLAITVILLHTARAFHSFPARRTITTSVATSMLAEDKGEKRVRKLKKALKRIGELRHQDYLDLTTDQRIKVHGEHLVLEELASLLDLDDDSSEALRMTLQPGLAKPMPPSQNWSFEVSKARAKQKARERRQLEASLGLKPGELPKGKNVRKGDWRCPSCGALCWASRDECFSCGEPR